MTTQTELETLLMHLPMDCDLEPDMSVYKYRNEKVLKKVYSYQYAFPQHSNVHRNVNVWYILESGRVVGWNESPRSGWSFPVLGKKAIKKFYKFRSTIKPPKELVPFIEE